MKLLSIVIGAGIGAVGRYLLGTWLSASIKGEFPWGTLAVNLIGCLVIGIAWGLSERAGWSPVLRSFLFIGILGSFTTFSAFSIETISLLQNQAFSQAFMNIALNVIMCLFCVWLGLKSARLVVGG